MQIQRLIQWKTLLKSLIFTLTLISASLQVAWSKPLTVWHSLDGYHREQFKSILGETADKHNLELNIEDGIHLQRAIYRYSLKGGLPDIVFGPSDLVGLAMHGGYSPIERKNWLAKPKKHAWESVSVLGETLGIPVFLGNHFLLLSNKAAKQDNSLGVDLDTSYAWLMLYISIRGQITTEDVKQLDLRACTKTFDWIKEIRRRKLWQTRCDYNCRNQMFHGGSISQVINGDWAIRNAYDRLSDNLAITPLPTWDGIQLKSPGLSYAFFFPNQSLSGIHKKAIRMVITEFFKSAKLVDWSREGFRPLSFYPPQTNEPLPKNGTEAIRDALENSVDAIQYIPPHPMIFAMWSAIDRARRLVEAGYSTEESCETGRKLQQTWR